MKKNRAHSLKYLTKGMNCSPEMLGLPRIYSKSASLGVANQDPALLPHLMELLRPILSSRRWLCQRRRLHFLLCFKWYCRRKTKQVWGLVPLKELETHEYITGKTGSGKSSRLQQRVYAQWLASSAKEDCSIVFIDPHGDTVELIRRFDLSQKYQERLVYIDPCLRKGYTPVLNPLECGETEHSLIELQAQQVSKVLESMIGDTSLSTTMKALLQPCLFVLLQQGNGCFSDLQQFISGKCPHFVAMGRRCGVQAYERFFAEEFDSPYFNRTKTGMYARLQSLLNSQVFCHMTTGSSTINLEQLTTQGKVILFNISKGNIGEDVCEMLGRCIIAQIKQLAFKRAKLPWPLRKKIFLVIDEADTFLRGDTSISIILKEARKYGVHLILATQNLVNGREYEHLKRNLMNNTNTKIIGMNGTTTLKPLSQETGIGLEDLRKLKKHQFRVKSGSQKARRCSTRNVFYSKSPLLIGKEAVSKQTKYFLTSSSYYQPKQEHSASQSERNQAGSSHNDPIPSQGGLPHPRFTF